MRVLICLTAPLVMFGGINPKNAQVSMGGVTEHTTATWFERYGTSGKRMISISPQQDDSPAQAEWWPIEPGTDTALMLALAYVLETEALADRSFLESHCTGYEDFLPYLLGKTDGTPKTPKWAATICDLPAEQIVNLAHTIVLEPLCCRFVVATLWLHHSLLRNSHNTVLHQSIARSFRNTASGLFAERHYPPSCYSSTTVF